MNPSQFRDIVCLKNNWQSGANLSIFKKRDRKDTFLTVGTEVYKSKLFTIHGYKRNEGDSKSPNWVDKAAIVHCFDPTKNEWKQKESTCRPHFGSGRVYLVINKFSVDDGIRIPPEQIYDVHLDEWEILTEAGNNAVLCYLPVKRESLKTDHDKRQADQQLEFFCMR